MLDRHPSANFEDQIRIRADENFISLVQLRCLNLLTEQPSPAPRSEVADEDVSVGVDLDLENVPGDGYVTHRVAVGRFAAHGERKVVDDDVLHTSVNQPQLLAVADAQGAVRPLRGDVLSSTYRFSPLADAAARFAVWMRIDHNAADYGSRSLICLQRVRDLRAHGAAGQKSSARDLCSLRIRRSLPR